jgi:small subunit ribosomal protein S20
MANHKSAIRSIRKNKKRRLKNRSQHRTARSIRKKLLLEIQKLASSNSISEENKKEIFSQYSTFSSNFDKLAKKNIVHKNKASRLKRQFHKKINQLNSKPSEA